MKRLAFAALAAIACSIITVSAQAAPVSGVGKLASASQASSLVDHVRWFTVITIARCSGIVAIATGGDN